MKRVEDDGWDLSMTLAPKSASNLNQLLIYMKNMEWKGKNGKLT